MNITINGEGFNLDERGLTVSELLIKNSVEMPDMVSVQLNGEFVEKDNFDKQIVSDGDEVDFLYFMGGGANVR